MSEQPTPATVSPSYGPKEGSRFENDAQFDLHKNTVVPKYNAEAIAHVHMLDAARKAKELATAIEQDMQKTGPELAAEDLARLAAVRKAALSGQIGVAN